MLLESVDQNALADLVGTVNDDVYIGRPSGEVLFNGASGSYRADGKIEVTFNFEISKNRTGIVVGDITGIDKEGWDYLWIRYQSDVDADTLVKIPAFAYVERVYPRADFNALPLFA